MKIRNRIIGLLLTAIALLMPIHAWALDENASTGTSSEREPAIYLNDEILSLEDPLLTVNGRIMAPVRHIAQALGGNVVWDQEEQEVRILSVLGDEYVFAPDSPILRYNDVEYRMDVASIVVDGRIYVPLRHVSEFMHARVAWDDETSSARLTLEPYHLVREGDTMATVAAQYGIEESLLVERNQLSDPADPLKVGNLLMTLIPQIMAVKIEAEPEAEVPEAAQAEAETKYSEEELMWLAKITMVEAGYEPYEGQLAVANVILNRVHDPRFPDTIYDVIHAPGQFPPASNGKLKDVVPNDSVWKAVKAAASGENNVPGAVYFHNPKATSGGFWNSLTEVAKIGNHRFLK